MNAFGQNQGDSSRLQSQARVSETSPCGDRAAGVALLSSPLLCPAQVSKYSLYFLYLGLGAFFMAYLQVACWTLTSA